MSSLYPKARFVVGGLLVTAEVAGAKFMADKTEDVFDRLTPTDTVPIRAAVYGLSARALTACAEKSFSMAMDAATRLGQPEHQPGVPTPDQLFGPRG